MRWLVLVLALLLSSCQEDTTPLTPFQCRVTGVNVHDTDQVTGQVRNITHYKTMIEVRVACMKPFISKALYGCTIPFIPGRYNIVVLDSSVSPVPVYNTALNHEYCHAYYEEWRHME